MTQWTQEQTDLAIKLRGDGLSAASIAGRLGPGFSRNAVLGKFHRMGVAPSKQKKWSPPLVAEAKAAKGPEELAKFARENGFSPYAVRAKMQRVGAPAPLRAEVAEAEIQLAAPIPMNPVTLLDRGPDQCCFPIGDPRSEAFRYCGARKPEGSAYCTRHKRIMYQPRAERPKRQQAPPSRVTRDLRGEWV
jgi:GcrA cell cycle regulator